MLKNISCSALPMKLNCTRQTLWEKNGFCVLFDLLNEYETLKNNVKHHCMKNMFMSDIRSPQRTVIRALYDYYKSTGTISYLKVDNLNLLLHSASTIANWNTMCSEATLNILKRQNRPILVRVLTHSGPQYWAKECTVGCIRHSRQLYYTSQFADLFLSLLLTNEARISKCVDLLFLYFANTSTTPSLLPSYRPI